MTDDPVQAAWCERMKPCGVCERPAVVMATVPMCGERPRYPLCQTCLDDLQWGQYVEDVLPCDW